MRGPSHLVFASGGAVSVIGLLPKPKSASGQRFQFVDAVSQLRKLLCCLTSDLFCLQFIRCKLLPPTLHSTSWYWCECIEPVFHLGQSLTLLNSRVRRCKILKYIKVRFKLPVCISVLPVHSLDDGACHKRNLEEAGETIRWCIAGSLLVGSGPFRRPQGFPSDY